MKNLLILCTGLLLALAQPAAADWQYTKWGMTVDQVAQASDGRARPLDAADIDDSHKDAKLSALYNMGDVTLTSYFLFGADGKLSGVQLEAHGPEIAGAFDLLLAKYGDPLRTSEDKGITTRFWTTADRDNVTAKFQAPADGAPNAPAHLFVNYEARK